MISTKARPEEPDKSALPQWSWGRADVAAGFCLRLICDRVTTKLLSWTVGRRGRKAVCPGRIMLRAGAIRKTNRGKSVDGLQQTPAARTSKRVRYTPPSHIETISLAETLVATGRSGLNPKQMDFLRRGNTEDVKLFCAGDLSLLKLPSVSIVGTRAVTDIGRQRASYLARALCEAQIVVMSGLAAGVDIAAHKSAILNGGKTVAVIGTPLDDAYPNENAEVQELIYNEHLLVTPFPIGSRVFPSNFPTRNRVMAALSDATVIVEASESSGTRHQAAECVRLDRWLFISRSVAEDPKLDWPRKFIGNPKCPKCLPLDHPSDVIDHITR